MHTTLNRRRAATLPIVLRCAALAACCAPAAAQAQLPVELQPRGLVGPWGPRPLEYALVSGDGDVLFAIARNGATGATVARWRRGEAMEDLGAPPNQELRMIASSFDGRVALFWADDGLGSWLYVRWTEGQGFEVLPLVDARGLSASGDLVIGAVDLGGGAWQAARWTAAGGAVPYGPPSVAGVGANLRTSVGVDCSADGTVLAGESFDGTRYNAFTWTAAGGTNLLGSLPNTFANHPYALSADGHFLVGECVSPSGAGAVRWDVLAGGAPTVLSPGPGRATGVSRDGQVVVGVRALASGSVAGIWDANGTFTQLDLGNGLAGWVNSPTCSDDGSVVVGFVYSVNGPASSVPDAYLAVNPGQLGTRYCTAAPNSVGAGATLSIAGSTRLGDRLLGLVATGLPAHSAGLFMTSLTQGFASHPAGSQGDLCLGGAIGRFVGPGEVQGSGTLGAMRLSVDPATLPSPTGPVPVMAGSTWNFQAWYRDANPATTSNFTDAVALTLL
ncbi:MAG: hypothetical protein R3F49_17245 [Planctomycetota bacterium]